MNDDLRKQLLLDPEIKRFLKKAILEKAERYDSLLKIIRNCPDCRIKQILSSPITEADIWSIVERYEAEEEIKITERCLSNMCYALNYGSKKDENTSNWASAYEYAKSHVRIDDVVRHLTGEENFNRCIRCPFHDDSSASLKVYIKDNRFVCFGCNIRGSPIDFVIQYKNCSFREAVMFLSTI